MPFHRRRGTIPELSDRAHIVLPDLEGELALMTDDIQYRQQTGTAPLQRALVLMKLRA